MSQVEELAIASPINGIGAYSSQVEELAMPSPIVHHPVNGIGKRS